MTIRNTPINGIHVLEAQHIEDHRGFFARTWCARELESADLSITIAQCSISFNKRKGTTRGLHYQVPPSQEHKIVRCTMGSIYDVAVDLRPTSPTYLQWFSIELSAQNRLALYVPPGCAHGFQTLADDSEVFYMISEPYNPDSARTIRWNDPLIDVSWPQKDDVIISQNDLLAPLFDAAI